MSGRPGRTAVAGPASRGSRCGGLPRPRPRVASRARRAALGALAAAGLGAPLQGATQADGAPVRTPSDGDLLVEVRDAADGAPIDGAVVWLEPAAPGAARRAKGAGGQRSEDGAAGPDAAPRNRGPRIGAVRAPEAGRYRIIAPPGRYVLEARAAGYAPASRSVALPRPSGLALRLERAPLVVRELFARIEREAEGRARTLHRLRPAEARPLGGLSEWLGSLPGVEVRGRGPGGRETVSLRGSRPEAVRVTLDGVPLDDPLTGAADLSLLPTGSLDGALVALGAAPGSGGGATAGRVELYSRAPAEGANGALGIGSFGRVTAEASAGVGGRAGTLGVSLLVERARNDFPYENRVRPGHPEERRRNADREGAHATLSARLARLPLAGLLRVDAVERGSPGHMGSRLYDEARWTERLALAALRLGEPGGREATARYARRFQRYEDPRVARRETLHAEHAGVSAAWSPHAHPAWRLEAHLSRESVRGGPIDGRRARWTAGGGVSRRFGDGPLSLTPGLAFDAGPGVAALSPSVETVLRPEEGVRLWARAGQAVRLPTFADLFLASEHRVRPDPDLRPERVRLDAELGAGWDPSRRPVALRATGWYRRTDDPIVWLPSPTAVWSPRNAGHLEALGLELEADWSPGAEWRLGLGGTLARSRVRFGAADDRLPYEPSWSAGLAVERVRGIPRARLAARLVGSRPTDPAGTHALDPFARVDVRVRQPLRIGDVEVELDVAVLNLFDARYERVELFPEPGRQLELRLGLRPATAGLQAGGSSRSLSHVVEPARRAGTGDPARPPRAAARVRPTPPIGGRR